MLLGNQTADEQTAETVKYHNGMGFKPCDAYIGTQMAKYFERNGRLTERQAAYWRRRDVKGVMKIAAYTRQILESAEAKAIAKAAAADRVIE